MINPENEKLRNFFYKFFSNLGCNVTMTPCSTGIDVEKVPESFEKFVGKKSPYFFSFQEPIQGYEFIDNNHYIIKSIQEYLENRGETTLLEILIEIDPKILIPKKFSLKNSEVANFTKKVHYKFINRFSFLTEFQYLNETKKLLNSIFVKEGEIIDFDLEKYNVSSGNKRHLKEPSIEKDYNLSKQELQKRTQIKTQEIAEDLNKKLEFEIKRIKDHYEKIFQEHKEEFLKLNQEISQLEQKKQLSNFNDTEINLKLNKLRSNLLELENDEGIKKLKQEEEFFIQDETKKHSLNIKNKLINTTIISFPVFEFDIFLKNFKSGRIIKIFYDSLCETFSKLDCDVCKENLNDLIICSGGHLVCKNCVKTCPSCKEIFCEKCNSHKCNLCKENVCSKCVVRCKDCGSFVCKLHSFVAEDTGQTLCGNCLSKCFRCEKIFSSSFIKPYNGREICLRCYNKESQEEKLKKIFQQD